ncbi:MAG: dihydrodipicolinate synthase family protein [Terriglobia bacterium]
MAHNAMYAPSTNEFSGQTESTFNMTHTEIIGHLSGVFPPEATPFNRRGGIDEGAFRANMARHLESGLSGVLVAGSTGETPYLTDDERLRLVEIARALVKPPQLLIAGTGLESTAQTLTISREAIARGADAILVVPPDYYKAAMRPEVLEAHFRAVADGVRRPLLIYSIPQFTGFSMDPAMIGRLSRHPNIPGMKESSGNVEFNRAILSKCRKGFRLFIGNGMAAVAGLQMGAAGAILSQANFEPLICLGIYEAFLRGDLKTAENLKKRLALLIEEITAPHGIPGIKAAMDLSGYGGGLPRAPLMPVSAAARKKIAAALRRARAGLDV